MKNTFYAMLGRMKYIRRWSLMFSHRTETLAEHTTDVAIIAHGLCVIGNTYLNKRLNAERCAVLALFHDAAEVITGDAVTPVKHGSITMLSAYEQIEREAENTLISSLPSLMRVPYNNIFSSEDVNDIYLKKLVKAADKLSALNKCIEEEQSGNSEFRSAKKTTIYALETMRKELPELDIFLNTFVEPYGSTLDELMNKEG